MASIQQIEHHKAPSATDAVLYRADSELATIMGQNGRVDKKTHLTLAGAIGGRVGLMDQLSFNGSCSEHVKLEGAVKAHQSLLSVADSVSEKGPRFERSGRHFVELRF